VLYLVLLEFAVDQDGGLLRDDLPDLVGLAVVVLLAHVLIIMYSTWATIKIGTVNSRYLKFQGTVENILKYPKFQLSEFKDSLCKPLKTNQLHDDC